MQSVVTSRVSKQAARWKNNFSEIRSGENVFDEAGAVDELWMCVPSHKFIIHPSGVFRMTWDFCALLAILHEATLLPLAICFDFEIAEVVVWVGCVFFALDLVLSFLTGFFREGILVMRQAMIVRAYLTSWFVVDLLSTFPWHVVSSSGESNVSMLRFAKLGKMLRVLRLLRIAKLNMLVQRLEDLFCSSTLLIGISMTKIVFFFALLCHWCACAWGWLGHPDRHRSVNGLEAVEYDTCEPDGPCEPGIEGSAWRRRYGIDEKGTWEQYLFSLRFSIGLFTGADIGIQPGFWAERVFVVIMMFTSLIMCSTVISQICMIFHKLHQERSVQTDLMQSFKEFMVAGRVPYAMQAKVKRYLEFQFKARRNLQVRRFEMMERLSPWLYKELKVHLNKNVLVQHGFFRDMPAEMLTHTCCLASSMLCAPGDIVVQRGQTNHEMYFLVRGKLSLTDMDHAARAKLKVYRGDRRDNLHGVTVVAPAFFGGLGIFRDEGYYGYTCSMICHSELLTVTKKDIISLATEFMVFGDYYKAFIGHHTAEEPIEDCSALMNG